MSMNCLKVSLLNITSGLKPNHWLRRIKESFSRHPSTDQQVLEVASEVCNS
jgi:hypothetical protein